MPITGLAVCVALMAVVAVEAQEPAKPLRWGADAAGGAPYIFKDPDDPSRTVGFEVDLKAALERELKRPIAFTQYEYMNLVPGVKRGDVDFAMNGMEITPDRVADKELRLSRPYFAYRLQLVIRAGEKRFHDYDSLKAFGKATVGTLEDTAAARLLAKDRVNTRRFADQLEPYLDLKAGRLDAVLMDLPIALYCVKHNAKLNADLTFAGDAFGKGYYAIVFRKQDESLAKEFDAALERLAKAGELKRVYEKWHLWNEDQEELFTKGVIRDITAEAGQKWTFAQYFPLLRDAAYMTVLLTVCSFALAVLLGLVVAVMRMYGPLPVRWLAIGYIEFFRGVPVMLVLFCLYYGLTAVIVLPPFVAAVLALGLTYAAYEAEIYRAGIESIPEGQWEAATALGMSPVQTFRRIILPQSFRIILPPMTNDLVALFKDTSVVSIIAVYELNKQYQELAKTSMMYVELGLTTAALYLLMSVPLGHLSRYLEKKWGKSPR
jgi:polar amino acid transport system substrate-binding protein